MTRLHKGTAYHVSTSGNRATVTNQRTGATFHIAIVMAVSEYRIDMMRLINGRVDKVTCHSTGIGHRHNNDYVASERIALMQALDCAVQRVFQMDSPPDVPPAAPEHLTRFDLLERVNGETVLVTSLVYDSARMQTRQKRWKFWLNHGGLEEWVLVYPEQVALIEYASGLALKTIRNSERDWHIMTDVILERTRENHLRIVAAYRAEDQQFITRELMRAELRDRAAPATVWPPECKGAVIDLHSVVSPFKPFGDVKHLLPIDGAA